MNPIFFSSSSDYAWPSSGQKAGLALVSSDGVRFVVSSDAAKMSSFLIDYAEMISSDDNDSSTEEIKPIELEDIESKALHKVVQYMEYHHNNRAEEIEKPLRGRIEDVICDWDKKYLEIDQSLLVEIIMAANFLGIRDLLDLTCAKVASMVKGKSSEQIRDMFGIESDFTPEEEEKIRDENKWCDEA